MVPPGHWPTPQDHFKKTEAAPRESSGKPSGTCSGIRSGKPSGKLHRKAASKYWLGSLQGKPPEAFPDCSPRNLSWKLSGEHSEDWLDPDLARTWRALREADLEALREAFHEN